MGFAPPQDFPPPDATASADATGASAGASAGGASASGGIDFPPSPKASPCGFSLALPRLKFAIKIPKINFPPPLPSFFLAFKLSCDLSKPVDLSAGISVPYGGGRTFNGSVDLDDLASL